MERIAEILHSSLVRLRKIKTHEKTYLYLRFPRGGLLPQEISDVAKEQITLT